MTVDPDASEAAQEHVARQFLLRSLAAAPRTRHQLLQGLNERGISTVVAERLLDRFTELGYIDDEAFARAWIRQRQGARARARGVIRQELQQRGVPQEVASAALAEMTSAEETEQARAFALRKAMRVRGLPEDVALRRLSTSLMRRGFHWSIALSAAQDALQANAASQYAIGHNEDIS